MLNDHAQRDARSVAAMLRGRGDGRERPYLRFHARLRERAPDLDDLAIGVRYAARVEAKACRTRRLAHFARLGFRGAMGLVRLLLRLAGLCLRLAVVLALGLLRAAFPAPSPEALIEEERARQARLLSDPPPRGLRTTRSTLGRPR